MKFIKTQNTWKASNFSMNMTTMEAFSYKWWLFVCKDEKGRIIFNNTTYSSSTNRHQSKAWKLLNYKADLILRYTKASLDSLENAYALEIESAMYHIKELNAQIEKKGSKKAKNEQRMKQIETIKAHINKVKLFSGVTPLEIAVA